MPYRFRPVLLAIAATVATAVAPARVSAQPVDRQDYGFAWDPVSRRGVMFGGRAILPNPVSPGTHVPGGPLGDLFLLVPDPEPHWQPLVVAQGPSARWGHVMAFDAEGDRFVVYGGDDGTKTLSDVWELRLDPTPTWTEISPSEALPGPGPCGEASAVFDRAARRLIVFGGYADGTGAHDDLWALDLAVSPPKWTLLDDGGAEGPGGRAATSLVLDDATRRLFLYAGRTGGPLAPDQNETLFYVDLWTYDLDATTPAWQPVTTVGSQVPPARYDAALVFDAEHRLLVLHGGRSLFGSLDDLWILKVDGDASWRRQVSGMEGIPALPGSRSGHAAFIDSLAQRYVVLGGGNLAPAGYLSAWNLWSAPLDAVTPAALSFVEAVEIEGGGVRLRWSGLDLVNGGWSTATVERRPATAESGDAPWSTLGSVVVLSPDLLEYVDRTERLESRYAYRLRSASGEWGEEVVIDTPGHLAHRFGLIGIEQAAEGGWRVSFDLDGSGGATLEAYDVRGRRIDTLDLAGLGPGSHTASLGAGRSMAQGVYFVRLRSAVRSDVRRALRLERT